MFAPAANAKSEDDGYLMTYVYDASTDSSSFVIMDAASMDDEPVAVVQLPRVPSGFHGSWIPFGMRGRSMDATGVSSIVVASMITKRLVSDCASCTYVIR